MGLFDFLKSKKTPAQDQATGVDKGVARLARVVANKHAQTYDRMEAIQQLASLASPDAAAALLRRFTYYIEPSITDQDEKEVAFRGVLAAKENAIEPIRDFCVRAESLTWPLKILEEILSEENFVDELLLLLDRFDTEYTKNVEPKLQLIATLEPRKRDDVRLAVEPFLQDVNEPVRFHAAATVLAQDNLASVPALCRALADEESLRVRNRIAEGLAARAWSIPQELRAPTAAALPQGFSLSGATIVRVS